MTRRRPDARVLHGLFAVTFLAAAYFLLAGFLGESFALDGLVNYRESIAFYDGGIGGLLRERDGSMHPPLVYLLSGLGFGLFGPGPASVQLVGVLLLWSVGHCCIALLSSCTDRWTALLGALAICLTPLLMIAFFQLMSEALIVAGMLWLAYALVVRRSLGLAIALCACLALVKQTAVAVVAAAAISCAALDPLGRGTRAAKLRAAALLCLAYAATAALWLAVLAAHGGRSWDSQILGGDERDPYRALLRALAGNPFASPFLRQNLENALLLNFHWVVALLAAASLVLLATRGAAGNERARALLLYVFLCAALYALAVFPFPTWTIPRYAAPVVACLALAGVIGIGAFAPSGVARRLPLVALVALLFSAERSSWDPLSAGLFGYTSEGGEQVYDAPARWRGLDRVMYNLEFMAMARAQNAAIERVLASGDLAFGECSLRLAYKLASIEQAPRYFPQFRAPRHVECVRPEEARLPEVLDRMRRSAVVALSPGDVRDLAVLGVRPVAIASP